MLTGLDPIPVCVAYEIDGTRTTDMPPPAILDAVRPIFEQLPGWQEDVRGIRTFNALPDAARSYVTWIESALGLPVRYVSVGPRRDELIVRSGLPPAE